MTCFGCGRSKNRGAIICLKEYGREHLSGVYVAMILADADKSGRVLTISYSQNVGVEEMKASVERVKELLLGMEAGFRMLTDLSNLESMDEACAPYVGEIMDLCKAKEMKKVARVIPDPRKDIGFALISCFHYGSNVNWSTHQNLTDAIQNLST
jgi:hypothetical protein